MAKSGQARVLKPEEQERLFQVIKNHRYPEKNTAIMQISFKLGLRVQEIALLQLKDVCRPKRYIKNQPRDFELLEIMALPAAYTKGSDAMQRSKEKYLERRSMTFKKADFDKIVRQVEKLARAGAEVNPEEFYPPLREHKGKSRDLPMVDLDLREALTTYIELRLSKDLKAKPTDPLFITQRGGPYSPNTLQERMAVMLRGWAGVEKASSHSGRRSLITNVIHKQKRSLKVAQKIAGHKNPSTTILYDDPPEEEISSALGDVSQ